MCKTIQCLWKYKCLNSPLLTQILGKGILIEAENVFTKLFHEFSCPVCVSVLSICPWIKSQGYAQD